MDRRVAPLDSSRWLTCGTLRGMPFYALIGRDGPRGLELRKLHRADHLGRLQELEAAGRIRHAGPLYDEGGQAIGSLVVFEAEDLERAREIVARDPYVAQGVFESYELRETKVVFPK
jgi:uncharacterized protein YciI